LRSGASGSTPLAPDARRAPAAGQRAAALGATILDALIGGPASAASHASVPQRRHVLYRCPKNPSPASIHSSRHLGQHHRSAGSRI